jgi:thiol-disulfide isomerase/thioredoxin
MDKTIKIAVAVLIIVIIGGTAIFVMPLMKSASPAISGNAVSDAGKVTVFFFYGEECPHCHNVMPFIQNLSKKYPDVNFQLLETWHNETNLALSSSLNKKLGIQNPGVPEVIVVGNNTPLIGDLDIPAYLEGVILEQIKKK